MSIVQTNTWVLDFGFSGSWEAGKWWLACLRGVRYSIFWGREGGRAVVGWLCVKSGRVEGRQGGWM